MKLNEENNMRALRFLADVPGPVSRRLGGDRPVKSVEEIARNVFQQQSLDAQQGSTSFVSDLEIGEDIIRLTRQSRIPDLDEARSLHAAVDRKTADTRGHQQTAWSNRFVRVLQQAEHRLDCAVEQSRVHGLAAAGPMICRGQVGDNAGR